MERSLANVREAHQKALAMAAALEEEIEQLSCLLVRSWTEVHGCIQRVGTVVFMDPEGRSGDTTRCDLRNALPPTSNTTPPEGTQSQVERQWLLRTPIWRSHWNWGQRSPAFSEGQPRTWKRKKKRHPLLNPQ